MKPNEFIAHLKNEFKVCDANMGNLPHRFRLEEDKETGESILPMPKEIYGDYAKVADVISFKRSTKYRIKLVNLSCKVMSKSRFIREYNSIARQIKSPVHPLNRVILDVGGRYYLINMK